ncbi:MAG TPA: DUF192 domain-containing protein [Actinomycetes bacterium]|nr:DUF192 domain-containing protein [Actinomycetes bacterium]
MKRSPSPSTPDRLGSPWRRPSAARGPLLLAVALVVAALAAGWIAIASRTSGNDTQAGTGSAPATSGSASATGGPRRHTYLLEPAGWPPARVSLEVAADEPARERGLSHRTDVPSGTGMVFLFPGDTTASFWMKDTLVPLQIAFVAADGRVVSTFEMAPCRADPCATYTPSGAYRYAVELPSGAFTAAGVGEGDRVVPENPAGLPRAS